MLQEINRIETSSCVPLRTSLNYSSINATTEQFGLLFESQRPERCSSELTSQIVEMRGVQRSKRNGPRF
jgi:hypothetical protein